MKTGIRALAAFISVIILAGCSGRGSAIGSPFTELGWEATEEEMKSIEGEPAETYASIYKGTTYTYPRQYLGRDGVIKYMYDDTGRLCNVSWSYTGDSADNVTQVYRAVCDDTEKLFGSGQDDDGVGNYCRMWLTDSGTVMANAVITKDVTVMQIAYMSKEVSKQGKQEED